MVENWCIRGCDELENFLDKINYIGLTGNDNTGCYWINTKNKWCYDGSRYVKGKKLITFKQFLKLQNKPNVYELW